MIMQTSEPTGNVFIGDVGQSRIEEIDIMYPDSDEPRNGLHYGWAAYEGTECFKSELCGDYGRILCFFIICKCIYPQSNECPGISVSS